MKPAIFVNMNRKINYDVFENQVLKNSVLGYLKDMKSQDARLKKGIAYLKKEIQQKNDLLEKKREEYHQIKYNYAIDVGWKKKKETEISLLEKEVQKLKTKMMNLIGLSRELAHVQSTIDTVLKSPFFQKISPLSSDIKKVKDLRYRNILQRLSLVNDYNQETSKKWNNLGFAIKKSELMFEYFCLFRLFDVLDLLGFQSNQEDFLNTYGINEIPSESEYVFIKDDLKIKIIYDKEIPLFEDCNENDSLYCTTYGPRKPDYIVMLYHKDVFKKALILDAKYRKTKYLYCENERTQVQNTMMHYRLFEYRKSKTENIRTCINQVVVLYPKQEKDIQIKNFTDLDFIPIQISDKQPEDRLITLFENWISD